MNIELTVSKMFCKYNLIGYTITHPSPHNNKEIISQMIVLMNPALAWQTILLIQHSEMSREADCHIITVTNVTVLLI